MKKTLAILSSLTLILFSIFAFSDETFAATLTPSYVSTFSPTTTAGGGYFGSGSVGGFAASSTLNIFYVADTANNRI